MIKINKALLLGALAVLGARSVIAHENDDRYFRSIPRIEGVWLAQVSVTDCTNPSTTLFGPFQSLLTFHADGTIAETAPAPPNSQRSVSHGLWRRAGRNSFDEALVFQRLDVTGVFLGTQVIHATLQLTNDSYTAQGKFETKEPHGITVASGCTSVVATRFE